MGIYMKLNVILSSSRGVTQTDWLKSFHSFNFNNYYSPRRDGFGSLVVLNEDFVAAHKGFGMHGHADMEIVTVVLSGALSHTDSTGGKGEVKFGEVQAMSAGTGVRHSEMNAGDDEVHLFQIWIMPATSGIKPSYRQKKFDMTELDLEEGKFVELAGGKSGLAIHQDACVMFGRFDLEVIFIDVAVGRGKYVHVISGSLLIGDLRLGAGDAVELNEGVLVDTQGCELLVIDVKI